MLKGTIIENSLADKGILNNLKVENTRRAGDWILHDVLINEDQISLLSQCLADGPWYIHLWRSGEDTVIVVFKNKTFTIKFSDKSTWTNAVAYGKSIGIPEKQLDFPID
jgi:hypothetical protein